MQRCKGDAALFCPVVTAFRTRPPKRAASAGGPEEDWVRACKTGEPAGADFAYSGPLTEICLLGNIAKRVDTRIEWDAENLTITNLPEANRYVRTRYRPGWTLF